jgi:hypothetical protein
VKADGSKVEVWCGNYPLRRDDGFFVNAVRTGRLADEKARGRDTPADRFAAEIGALREEAPPEGRVLVEEIEHRWRFPDALPTLYVLTCEMTAKDGSILVLGSKRSRHHGCLDEGREGETFLGAATLSVCVRGSSIAYRSRKTHWR